MSKTNQTTAEQYYQIHHTDERLTKVVKQEILFFSLIALTSSPMYWYMDEAQKAICARWYELQWKGLEV